jgi:putative flavoprotein involved in K+ transport
MESTPMVVVVGGGPGGLAVAACLKQRGTPVVVLDAGRKVGESWRNRYDRLHLHTPRIQSGLPGRRIPKRAGRWVARDDVAAYLEEYALHFELDVEHNVRVERVDCRDDGYAVVAGDRSWAGSHVVMATGYMCLPVMPPWPGAESFGGELIHAVGYRSPAPYEGKKVMVVGTGNTGAEIAADLAEGGASEVWLSYRTPPHIVPRQLLGVPMTLLGFPNHYLPAPLCDPVNAVLERATMGKVRRYGLPRPSQGLKAQAVSSGVIPIIDVGLAEQLEAGRVTPVPAVAALSETGVRLSDGTEVAVDAVIAATGYRRGLEDIVGHLGVLDDSGAPLYHAEDTHPSAPGLHFIGMLLTLKGHLYQMNRDARKIARRIS